MAGNMNWTNPASLPPIAFQHLLKRDDPDLILTDWGDSTILPRLREQAAQLELALPFNRDADAECSKAARRSFMSYGRMLFKNSATTFFGRLHVDTHNSFIADKCDLRRDCGSWRASPNCPCNMPPAPQPAREFLTCRWNWPIATASSSPNRKPNRKTQIAR